MKRFHVHLRVADLTASIAFYSKLFGAQPARIETDYAKWMLDEPRVNFAISTRGGAPGLDHLGFQAESADELAAMKAAAQGAEMALADEGETTCCYARSDKHWITDPQGVAWEHFHTLGDIPLFNELPAANAASACCAPTPVPTPTHAPARGKPIGIAVKASAPPKSSCC